MLYTRCTHCDAWLGLSVAQLRVAVGHVRCGACRNVFNALVHLDDQPPVPGDAPEPDAIPVAAPAPGESSGESPGEASATEALGASAPSLPAMRFELLPEKDAAGEAVPGTSADASTGSMPASDDAAVRDVEGDVAFAHGAEQPVPAPEEPRAGPDEPVAPVGVPAAEPATPVPPAPTDLLRAAMAPRPTPGDGDTDVAPAPDAVGSGTGEDSPAVEPDAGATTGTDRANDPVDSAAPASDDSGADDRRQLPESGEGAASDAARGKSIDGMTDAAGSPPESAPAQHPLAEPADAVASPPPAAAADNAMPTPAPAGEPARSDDDEAAPTDETPPAPAPAPAESTAPVGAPVHPLATSSPPVVDADSPDGPASAVASSVRADDPANDGVASVAEPAGVDERADPAEPTERAAGEVMESARAPSAGVVLTEVPAGLAEPASSSEPAVERDEQAAPAVEAGLSPAAGPALDAVADDPMAPVDAVHPAAGVGPASVHPEVAPDGDVSMREPEPDGVATGLDPTREPAREAPSPDGTVDGPLPDAAADSRAGEDGTPVDPARTEAPMPSTTDDAPADGEAPGPGVAAALPADADVPVPPPDRFDAFPTASADALDAIAASGVDERESTRTAGALDADVPDVLRADVERIARERSPWRRFGITALAALLLLGIGVQYVWFDPGRAMRTWPTLAGSVERFCALTGCALPVVDDRSVLRLRSREVRIHPAFEGALQVTAVMVNEGRRAQTWPGVRFILFNVNGDVIASRRFTPAEYLGEQYIPDLPMSAGEEATIRLELVAPEDTAVSFEFEFI